MGILAKVYIKLEKTTFSEMENDNSKYKAECTYSIYRDENKGSLITTKETVVENLSLEELNLGKIYQVLMSEFSSPEFV